MKILSIKGLLQLALVILVVLGIGWRLQANKANNKEEAELANLKAKAIPVKVDTVKYSDFVQKIEVSGHIKNHSDLILFAETQGRITKVYKEKGAWVNKGESILQIDNSVLKEQFELANTNYQMSKLDYERMKNLVAGEAATKKNLEDIELKFTQSKAELAKITRQLENTKVTSPVSGYINDTYYEKGMLIAGNTKLCNIISKNNLIITTEVTASEVFMIETGDSVMITVDEYPDQIFTGRVTNIAQKASSNSRFAIEISIAENKTLRAGMFARAFIEKIHKNVIQVNRNAVSGSLQEASVFLVQQDTLVEQPVKIKRTIGNKAEVIGGLNPHQIYVTSGTINLYESAKIRIIK